VAAAQPVVVDAGHVRSPGVDFWRVPSPARPSSRLPFRYTRPARSRMYRFARGPGAHGLQHGDRRQEAAGCPALALFGDCGEPAALADRAG
jgi:hypothetical protein